MITSNFYRTMLSSLAYDANALLVKHDEGADMKETNDKLIERTRTIYEFALRFKGQEEADDK